MHGLRNRRLGLGVAVVLLLAGCGPADYYPPLDLSLSPQGTPWQPAPAVFPPTPEATRPRDGSLITGAPCAPPCWQGLVPGVTTAQEIELFLESSPYVTEWVKEAQEDGGVIYRWQWGPPHEAAVANALHTQDKILTQIVLTPDLPITLGEAVDALALPTHATAFSDIDGWRLHLYYPPQGLRLELMGLALSARGGQQLCPGADHPIHSATYMPAGTLPQADAAAFDVSLQGWEGTGCLSLMP